MIQQINLYQPVFRQPRKVFSLTTMLQIAGIVLVGMLTIYAIGRWQLSQLSEQAQALHQQTQQAQQQLTELSKAAKAQQAKRDALQSEIGTLQDRLAQRQAAFKQLQNMDLSQPGGFSAQLTALGKAAIPGVWLTGIQTDGANRTLTLQGAARRADLIPAYLATLGEQPTYHGTRFKTLSMERDSKSHGIVTFTVSNADSDQRGRP